MKFLQKKKKPRLGMRSTLTFGKYKDKHIGEIIDDDPGYITWCMEQDIFTLNSYTRGILNSYEGYFDLAEDGYGYGWDPLWD